MVKKFAAVLLLSVCSGAGAQVIPNVTFTNIPLPPNTNPYALGEGKEGRVWFTDWRNTQVGFVAGDNSITRFKLTDSSDPQNLVRPLEIVEGPDANAWFTYYITNNSGSPLNRAGVAKVTQSGQVTMFPIASGNACRQRDNRAADCGIIVGPDGALWFTQSLARKVGRITTAGQITEFAVNSGLLGLDTIATGSDGNLWVTDFFRDRVFKVTPSGGVTPIASCRAPDRITSGPDGNLWMVCFQSVAKMTTTGILTAPAGTGVSATYPVPSPVPGFQSGAVDIASAHDGNLYFALSTFSTTDGTPGPIAIGRINPQTGPNGYATAPQNGRPLALAVRASQGPDEIELVIAATDGTRDLLFHVRTPSVPPPIGPKLVVTTSVFGVPSYEDATARLGSVILFLIRARNEGDVDLNNVEIQDIPSDRVTDCRLSCPATEGCVPSELKRVIATLKPKEDAFLAVSCTMSQAGTAVNNGVGRSLSPPLSVVDTVQVQVRTGRDGERFTAAPIR
jgi:virginiamycin B lyase